MIQKVSVSGILTNDKKLLVVKRSPDQEFFPNYYEFPGGKVEFGESPEEAVSREVLEETGLSGKPFRIVTCRSYLSRNGTQHNVELFYLLKLLTPDAPVKLSKEHVGYLWVDKDNLAATQLPETDPVRSIIQEIADNIDQYIVE